MIETCLKQLRSLLNKNPQKAHVLIGKVIKKIEMVPVMGQNKARFKARIFGQAVGPLELAEN